MTEPVNRQPEPEIIPPGAPLPRGARVWVSSDSGGAQQIYVRPIGPVGMVLLTLGIGAVAVLAIVFLLGVAVFGLATIGVLILAGMIAGLCAGPHDRYANPRSDVRGKRVAGVLDGIRVLDFGRYIAGPFCAALLGDLGAEVIRIERREGGEDRGMIPVGTGPDGGGAMFIAMNRNKLGMTLDPAAPKGREIVKKLVATADVVVANLPPRVLRSLALDLDSLRQTKPDIVLTTVTGFGAGGRLSDKHGFDGIGQAMSGAVFLSGMPEQPIMTKVPWVDFGTAFLSAFGTLAALMERGKTGRGQKVEGALLRTAVAISNAMLMEQALTGVNRMAAVNRGFNNAPGDVYRCKDGWIVTTVIGPYMFGRWCEMVGEPGWTNDPRFNDDQARADNGVQITAKMNEWCAARSCEEALAALEKASIVTGQVYSPQQALDEPHIRDAGLLAEREFPGIPSTLPLAPTPIELSETPGTYRRRAPLVGEHTDEILASLGYGAAEIATLRAEKVV